MPEEVHRVDSREPRARTGPRHAAPKKPLLTRLQMPAGKAIAIASMPTAILMGMGLTPTLARADDKPSGKNLTIDEYKECVDALEEESEEGKDASASPSPSDSASGPASDDKEEQGSSGEDASGDSSADSGSSGDGSSSDSGSDDEPEPTPSPSESKAPAEEAEPAPSPSPSESESKNPLDPLGVGEALKDIFTPDDKEAEASASPSPTPSASASEDEAGAKAEDTTDEATDTAKKTVEDTAEDVKDTAEKAEGAVEDTAEKAEEAAGEATASPSPSPSASSTTDPENCPAATDDEGGLEQGIPALADDPWQLEASSLLLKGADYQGVVKVKTANGTVKEVLKYVISDGTDIGDLHQTVDDKDAGVKHHVQAGKGTTSTIRDGKTVMYTESISGNLLGLVPVTFDPKHPPPLNIPLIYFTKVKVVQAAQFGGTLTVPGLQQYNTPLG
ncbi:hypothetical protein G5C60_45635 [Streptomyces sp. HC44]|uniref:Membrane-bound hydrophilic protein n=1 Tax=Streptomyces scabichelini TaxID=2711217 RepID=A0A6G4VKQ7_9ACTN|nr:hypothetical protein [Streptomyces scabichelini]